MYKKKGPEWALRGTMVGGRERLVGTFGLDYVQGMRSDPNVELAEAAFQLLFEVRKKGSVLGQVRHIDEEPGEVIFVGRILEFPCSTDGLRFPRRRPELVPQLGEGLCQQFLRHGVSVIMHQRDQNLVAA